MNVSVMLAVTPKEAQLISSGNMELILRKTAPTKYRLGIPFTVYVYVKEKPDDVHNLLEIHNSEDGKIYRGNGKVIGEFQCKHIENFGKFPHAIDALCRHCHLWKCGKDYAELHSFFSNHNKGFGWFIKDFILYEKPLKITDFQYDCAEWHKDNFSVKCKQCEHYCLERPAIGSPRESCACYGTLPLTKAPQNWQYICRYT